MNQSKNTLTRSLNIVVYIEGFTAALCVASIVYAISQRSLDGGSIIQLAWSVMIIRWLRDFDNDGIKWEKILLVLQAIIGFVAIVALALTSSTNGLRFGSASVNLTSGFIIVAAFLLMVFVKARLLFSNESREFIAAHFK